MALSTGDLLRERERLVSDPSFDLERLRLLPLLSSPGDLESGERDLPLSRLRERDLDLDSDLRRSLDPERERL